MERISPKNRFSRHAKSLGVEEALLRDAGVTGDFVLLSGGFMNANYRVGKEVIRFYSTDASTASREYHALKKAQEHGVKVPAPLRLMEFGGRAVLALEYLDGITLEDFLLDRNQPSPELFEEIGAELAKIHGITFSACGFLDGNLNPGREFESFGPFLRDYIRKVLSDLEQNPKRLSFSLNKRLRALVEERWSDVMKFEPRCELTHCDFNPKNILVTKKGKLLAVLDWEFCLAGNGIEDFGNFFRFDYDYPAFAKESFAKGYRSVRPVAEGWDDAARLADLGSMCSFLERKEDYPETFHTARTVIAATLQHFNA